LRFSSNAALLPAWCQQAVRVIAGVRFDFDRFQKFEAGARIACRSERPCCVMLMPVAEARDVRVA
jgi:hypothetical protein